MTKPGCSLCLPVIIGAMFSLPIESAADSDIAAHLREQALSSDRGWQIVESLTTEIGPRLAGTAADKAAVAWAKALLERGDFDKVWLEPVRFPVWQRQREIARIVSPYPQPLQITALGYSGSTPGMIKAEVLEFATLAALEAAPANSLQNKIAFVNTPLSRHRDSLAYREVVAMRHRAGSIAKRKGAIAALIRSVGTSSHRFPHTGRTNPDSNPLAAAALSVPDAQQLSRILTRARADNTPVVMALDIAVSQIPGGESWNVMAQLNGREQPEKLVLIGAHLDSWDLGTGAIDNGAGVAITAAAAELIAALPDRPRRSVRLVLFANEEQTLWGARAYAERHAPELQNHLLASESDFGAGPVWELQTAWPALMDAAMPLLSPLGISAGGAAVSGGPDIKPMERKGVPVFRLRQDGSDYFDYHHTADDTLDKIDPEALKQNIAAWAVVTYLAAELAQEKHLNGVRPE